MYNFVTKEMTEYYKYSRQGYRNYPIIPHILFFVKKGFNAMDATELTALRQMIIPAVEQCTDTDLLDLIYKLLIQVDIL